MGPHVPGTELAVQSGKIEVVLGVHLPVAHELEEPAVKLIGATFQDDIDLSAACPPELGRVIAGLNLEFLDRVDGRKSDILVEVGIVVIDSIQQEVVGLVAGAVDVDGAALRRVLGALGRQLTARHQ